MRTRVLAMMGLLVLLSGMGASPVLATTTINKQFTPATVDPGDTSRLRISIFNSSLVALTAAAVTDNLPAQVAIATPANVTDTCGFGAVMAVPGTQAIVLTNGTVPAGTGTVDGFCYLEVDVVSTLAGNWPNTIPANGPGNGFVPGGPVAGYQATEGGATVSNATPATATLSVRLLSVPTGSKTFSPSAGFVNEPVTLNIVLANPNTGSTIPLTTFTDNLPAGMVVANPAAPTLSCTGSGAVAGTLTANPGDTSVQLTGGVLGLSGTCTLSVRVVQPSITGTSQTLTNALAAGAIGNLRNLTSAAFTRSIAISTPLTVSKAFVVSVGGGAIGNPVPAGSEFWARIDLGNNSTVTPITLTTFTDDLPAGMVVGSGTPVMDCVTSGGGSNGAITATPGDTSFTVTGGVIGVTGGTRRCRIHVPVTAAAAGNYINTLPAGAIGNTGGYPTGMATATANVNAQLTVSKTASAGTAAPGQPVTFTITINNWSGGPVTGVTLTDNLPLVSGQQMVIAAPSNFSASAGCVGGAWGNASGAAALTWAGGTVVGGSGVNPGTCTVSFRANAPLSASVGQTFANTLAVGAVTGTNGGGGGIGNTNSTTANVVMVAAASVSKGFSPGSVVLGGTSQLTVTLSNQTATALTNAALTDNLPSGLAVAAVPNLSTTCTGGVVNATPGGSSVSIGGAAIPGNGSCNFRVNVTGTSTGTKVNTIPANALSNDQGASNPGVATASLNVTAGLTGTKAFTPASVANGGVSRVNLRMTNPSALPLTNLTVTDGPMTNLVVATPANATTTCAGAPVITAVPGSNTVSMTGASLAAGANCDLLFDVQTSGNPSNWPNSIPAGAITSAEGSSNTSAVSATLGKLTTVSISINKSFDPVSVSAGQPSVLRIDLVNPPSSPAAVHGLSFSDALPAGMEVYPNPASSTTCSNGVVTAVPGSTNVSMSGATLPVGGTCSVFVRVTSTKFLNLSNTIPVGNVSTTEGLTNSVATTATLSTLQGVGVAKSFAPTNVAPGQPTTLHLALISTLDPGAPVPVTLHNVSFTDTLPVGVTVAPVPDSSTNCAGSPVVTANPGSGTVTLTGVDLAPNTSCDVFVDVVAASLGTYDNVIPKYTVTTAEGYVNQSDASATFNVLEAPVISKSFSPAVVTPGTAATLTIVISNANATPLHNALLVDTLPALLTVASTPNASTTCGGAVAAAPAGNTVQLTNGTLPASGSCTISVDVRSNTPGSYVNTIPVGALQTAEGVSNTNPATATLSVQGPPGVTKAFAPAALPEGQVAVLTLALGNPNPAPANLVSALVDTLPAGLVVAATPGVTGTCTLAGVTATAGGNTLAYGAGNSIPTGGCTINVNVTAAVAGSYTNTIPVGGLATDVGSNGTAAAATVVFTPTPVTDVALTKTTAVPTVPAPGTSVYFTLTVDNKGPLPADGTVVTDPAVAGISKTAVVTCVASGGATCPAPLSIAALEGAGVVITTFPVGGSVTIELAANVSGNVGDTRVNTAQATLPSGLNDSQPANNVGQASITLAGSPDLALAKTHGGTFVLGQPGGQYTLTVANVGNAPTTGTVTVVDTPPPGVTLDSMGGTGWTCVVATATCQRSDSLAPGASYPPIGLTATVASNAPSPLVNSATVATSGDPNPGNDTGTDSVVPLAYPDLTINKTHTGSFVRGGTGVYTLTISNLGPGASTGAISVADTLPAGLTALAFAGSGWTCNLAGMTCSRSDSLGVGDSYPPLSLTVAVAADAPGVLTNLAAVTGADDHNGANNTASDSASVTGTPDLAIGKTAAGVFVRGQTSGSFTLAVSNVGTAPTTGVVTVQEQPPAGLAVVTMTGSGWACNVGTATCTRSDALTAGASYPDITVTMATAGNAPSPLTNIATVATVGDGNSSNDTANATIDVYNGPDLLVGKTHSGDFLRGAGGTFTLTVTNVGDQPTGGVVTLADALPAGLTATAVTGSGWSCDLPTLTCTRADALAPGVAYPPVTLTVTVSLTAAASLDNVATVTGGGDTNPGNNTAQDTVLPSGHPDLALSKTHAGNFTRGQTGAQFTLTVRNVGTIPTTAPVTLTDTLPAGLTATALTGPGWNCDLPTLTCTRSDALAVGTAYPDLELTVDVSLTAGNPLVNHAQVSTAHDPNAGNDVADDVVTVNVGPELAIRKTHRAAGLRGGELTFQVQVRNQGDLPTVGLVTVTDLSAPGFTVQRLSGTGWTCQLAPVPYCERGDVLLPGAVYPTLDVHVQIASDAPSQITNVATVAGGGDTDSTNNSASDTASVLDEPDLAVTKTHTGTFVRGGTGSFELRVSNVGNVATRGDVFLQDTVPAGLTVTAMAGSGWTCMVASATCQRADSLPVGASYPPVLLTVAVAVDAASPLVNIAKVQLAGDRNPANDQAQDTVVLTGQPDLAIVKSHTGDFTAGQPGVFQLVVSNVGGLPALGPVTVVDTLPAGLTATALTGPGWSCDLPSVSCTRPDGLAAGASYPAITVTVLAVNTGTLTNVATVTLAQDGNLANNTASDTVVVDSGITPPPAGTPALRLTKTHSGTWVRGQPDAQYQLVVTNIGTVPTNAPVAVVDTLPAGLTATALAGDGWACLLATLTCTRADMLLPGASYPAIVLTVQVALDAPSPLVNLARVTGGGAPPTAAMTATDTVTFTAPDLSIAKVHTGGLVRGEPATYRLTVRNNGNAPTVGEVTVTDLLPAGLTAISLAGDGWSCLLATLTCTRGDVLAPGAAYPVIELVVQVSPDAPGSIVNTATVLGGGDKTAANNTATSAATLPGGAVPEAAKIPTLSEWGLLLLVLLMLTTATMRRSRR